MNINYIHIRRWNVARGFLATEWHPLLCNFGGTTIAYDTHRIGDSIIAKYAAAECCDTDRFNKAVGRQIAEARLKKDDLYGTVELPADLERDLQEAIVEDYLMTRKTIILSDAINGGWVENLELRDWMQPVNPGYNWREEEEIQTGVY